MTFLFSPGRSQEVSVSTYLDSDGTEEALLTQEIWDTLKKTGERTAVSITSPYTYNHLGPIVEMKAEPPLKTLVCWTRPSATVRFVLEYPYNTLIQHLYADIGFRNTQPMALSLS